MPDHYESTGFSYAAHYRQAQSRTVISNPMDLQTMLKKAEQRHYKSKKASASKDDLDLVWSHCLA